MLWQQQQQQLLQPSGNISTPLPFSVHCCCNFVVVFVQESKGYVSFVQWSIHSYSSIRWFRPLISCVFFFSFFCIPCSYMWYLVKTALLSFFLSFLPDFLLSFVLSFPSCLSSFLLLFPVILITVIIIIILQFPFFFPTSKARLKTYGERAFAVAAPRLWNSIPLELRSSSSIDIFKRHLKNIFLKKLFNSFNF